MTRLRLTLALSCALLSSLWFSSISESADYKPASIPPEFSFVTSRFTTLGTPYYFRGVEYLNMKELIRSAEKIYANELLRISPSRTTKGGKLRIALSAPEAYDPLVLDIKNWDPDPNVNKAIIADLVEFTKLSDKSYIEAFRKSGIFESVVVEKDEAETPATNGADFVAWRYGQKWVIRKGDGPRSFVKFVSNTGFPGMLKNLPAAMDKAISMAVKDVFTLHLNYIGDKHFYVFNGDEYDGYDNIIKGFVAEWKRKLEDVPKVRTPIGGVARIIISSQKNVYYGIANPRYFNTLRTEEIAKVTMTFYRTIAQAHAEAFQKSGLFEDTVIESNDIDNITMEGYDCVIWQSPKDSRVWYFRTHGMKAAEPLRGFYVKNLTESVSNAGMQILAASKPRKNFNAYLSPLPPPARPGV